ncbi:MAG TPA: 3'-5' exonuclease, partial [Hyphomicrobiaceae bacterium]|nr:3'-5' exonuclease [Hyphomicrobiaceae bacterium]
MDIKIMWVFAFGVGVVLVAIMSLERRLASSGPPSAARGARPFLSRMDYFRSDHTAPLKLFNQLLRRDDWLVIDCETTGFDKKSEILEIAVVDANGTTLFERRVMPLGRIPSAASRVHGIYRKDLKGCPTWPEISEELRRVIGDRPVVSYNGEFEERLLQQTAEKWGVEPIRNRVGCVMKAYAAHRGIPHPWRRNDFKWHKLAAACRHEGIKVGTHHRAGADAELC